MNRPATIAAVLITAAAAFAAPQAAAQTLPGPTLAQSTDLRPPIPTGEIKGKSLLNSIVAFVLLSAVVGAASIPAKRGHQD